MNSKIKVLRLEKSPYYQVLELPTKLSQEISSFFELYLAKGFSRRTIRAYAFDLVVFFRFLQGKKQNIPPFAKIDIKTLIDFIQQEKARNAAPSSINRRLNTVDIVFRHCHQKLIPGTQSPVSDPTKFRTKRYLTMDSTLGIFPIYAKPGRTFRIRMPHKLVRSLEPHEVKAFFETLKTHRDRAIVTLMLACGLRCMEVLSIELSDIDTLSQKLRIHGKGNKERIVPLSPQVMSIVEKYLNLERPTKSKFSSDKEGTLFLVQKGPRRGQPMTMEALRSVFRYNRAASGIQHANPHRLRHTFGRNMAAAGMSLPTLQKILGHNDHRTTLKYINLTLSDVFADFQKAQAGLDDYYG